MTAKEEIAYFREQLLARRKAIVNAGQEDSASTSAVELDQSRVGRVSRVDAMQAQGHPGSVYRIDLKDCSGSGCIASMHGFDIFRVLALFIIGIIVILVSYTVVSTFVSGTVGG